MRRTLLLAASAALLLCAGPGWAQNTDELVGEYPMRITSKSGTDCGGEDNINLRVLAISGSQLIFGDERERHAADFDAAQMTFQFDNAAEPGREGRLAGRFTREPDAVRLDLTVTSAKCNGQATGSKPAPHLAPAAPAAVALPTAAAPAFPAAPAPAAAAAPAPAAGGMKDLLFWVPLGALLIGAGAFIGYLAARRKKPDVES